MVGVGFVRVGQFSALDVLHHLREDPFSFFRAVDDNHRDQGGSSARSSPNYFYSRTLTADNLHYVKLRV